MPIYQYQCGECNHQLEALQKMSDPKLIDCPECSASALKKQVTAAAFKLKGTGWYETDFKNSGAKPEVAKKTNTEAATKGPTGSNNSEGSNKPDSKMGNVPKSDVTSPKTASGSE